MDWLINNIGTIIVLAVVIASAVAAAAVIRRDKKRGVSSCGGSCKNCAMNCHGAEPKQTKNK